MVVKEGPEVVAAAKRNTVGEPLPKQHRPEAMRIDHILHAPPPAQIQPRVQAHVPMSAKPKKPKKRNLKTADRRKQIQQHVGGYEVLALSTAPSGLTFGQLLRGDAKVAEKELRRLFAPLRVRIGTKAAPALLGDNQFSPSSDNRLLQVVPAKVYASDGLVLFDTDAVPNLISAELVKALNLEPKSTPKTITVPDGTNFAPRARPPRNSLRSNPAITHHHINTATHTPPQRRMRRRGGC